MGIKADWRCGVNSVAIRHLDSILHAMRAGVGFSVTPTTLDALRNEIIMDIKHAYADGRCAATPADVKSEPRGEEP